ncbi:MAG TPA: hypothetical protein VFI31_18580 [Pirellulales bacterium]|nr:hypothetical protein [Pirellulales bacterium]
MARLPARDAFAYATACLEQGALELTESIDVALISAEALAGGSSLRKRLLGDIRRMLGESLQLAVSLAEHAAIAEVEREIAREFPFYFDESRLSDLHERYGKLRLT